MKAKHKYDFEESLKALENEFDETEPTCKGVVFRADVFNGPTKRGVMFAVRLNVVWKLSCPGCDRCGWISDDINEINNYRPIIGIEKAEHGKLYTLIVANEHRDWETGVIDEWDIEMIPWEEK